MKFPRLVVCRKCHPAMCMAFSPVADICPDRCTPELLELSAKLGARFSYREASDVLATFLPDQSARSFTTLRNRTLAIGNRIEEAERHQHWFEDLDYPDRKQLELRLSATRQVNLFSMSTRRTFRWSSDMVAEHSKRLLTIVDAAEEAIRRGQSLRLRVHSPEN